MNKNYGILLNIVENLTINSSIKQRNFSNTTTDLLFFIKPNFDFESDNMIPLVQEFFSSIQCKSIKIRKLQLVIEFLDLNFTQITIQDYQILIVMVLLQQKIKDKISRRRSFLKM